MKITDESLPWFLPLKVAILFVLITAAHDIVGSNEKEEPFSSDDSSDLVTSCVQRKCDEFITAWSTAPSEAKYS